MILNAFHWRENAAPAPVKPAYPQLSYYHRKMAQGVHPRQLRREGKPVVDQRYKANRV